MQALLKGSVDSGGQLEPVLSVPSHTLGSLTPSRTPHCPHMCLGTSVKVSQTRNCSLCPRVNEHRPWAPVFTLALCMRSHMQSLHMHGMGAGTHSAPGVRGSGCGAQRVGAYSQTLAWLLSTCALCPEATGCSGDSCFTGGDRGTLGLFPKRLSLTLLPLLGWVLPGRLALGHAAAVGYSVGWGLGAVIFNVR